MILSTKIFSLGDELKKEEWLDIPELEKLLCLDAKSLNRKEEIDEYLAQLKSFFDWYKRIVSQISKGKNYSETDLCNFLFKDSVGSELEFKNYIKYSMIVSVRYIDFLCNSVNEKKSSTVERSD